MSFFSYFKWILCITKLEKYSNNVCEILHGKGPRGGAQKKKPIPSASFSMLEDIKNSTIINNHKYIYSSLSVCIHEHAKDVAYIIFLNSHKNLKI